MSSRSGRRRDRSYSSSRSRSPDRRRRRRRRHSSSSSGSSPDSDRHYRSRRGETRKSDRHRRRRDYSSERSRPKDKRDRHRSRSRSPHRDSKRKKERKRHSSSRSRSRERTKSKKPSKDKEKTGKSSDAKGENPAEALKARVKALLAKSSEETAKAAAVEMSGAPVPTPGQTALIESNSFTSDKFVSKRSSKKWDVPPSGVSQKKAGKTFDVTTVDPSEFVPKVVPMCEVENALGREEGMGVMEEGGRDVVSIRQETTQSTPETEPVDRNQKWLQKLKKMRQKLADPPIN